MLFKANVMFEIDSLVMAQRYYLSLGYIWQIISIIKESETQIEVDQDLDISHTAISTASSHVLSCGSIDRPPI